MSMSKKIYGVVALLILLALLIFGVSAYSLRRSSAMTEYIVALGNRATALNNIDKTLLERTLLTREITQTSDEKAIAALLTVQMPENASRLEGYLKDYDNNIPANADPAMRETTHALGELWTVFVRESNRVGEIAVENTNNRAFRINDENVDFWNGLDKEFLALADKLAAQDDPVCAEFSARVLKSRNELMRFRLILVKYIHERDSDMRDFYAKRLGEIIADIDKTFTDLAAAVPPEKGADDGRKLFNEKLATHGKAVASEIMDLIARDANGRAEAHLVGPARAARLAMQKTTGDYLATITDSQLRVRDVVRAMERSTMLWLGGFSAAGVLVVALLAWRVISAVVSRLNDIIGKLDVSSSSVQGASGQISDSSQSLAEGATEQAASLEETSSALEQMASMTRQNADNANKTTQTMAHALKLVQDGSATVGSVTTAMAAISESSEEISNIIKTIEEIAFQTNLLALNAAVEAARAGEAGKGFAVVADEVRNLAQRSAQAAKDTSELIQSTVERVRIGSDNVQHLREGFHNIETAASEVGRLVTEISSATNEQAQGVDQVNTAVAQMDKVTQSNAASAEESASASEELQSQAEQLKSMVDDLVGLVEGGRGNGANIVRVPSASIFPDERKGNGKSKRPRLALPMSTQS